MAWGEENFLYIQWSLTQLKLTASILVFSKLWLSMVLLTAFVPIPSTHISICGSIGHLLPSALLSSSPFLLALYEHRIRRRKNWNPKPTIRMTKVSLTMMFSVITMTLLSSYWTWSGTYFPYQLLNDESVQTPRNRRGLSSITAFYTV